MLSDPTLENISDRVETDRHGYLVMSPPPTFDHGNFQSEISYLLRTLLAEGRTVTECPVSTLEGVKAIDVAWISHTRLAEIGPEACLPAAPEICVEVLSPANSRAKMAEKKALYFAAGAKEVWFCDKKGGMTFFLDSKSEGAKTSAFCPAFPRKVELQ